MKLRNGDYTDIEIGKIWKSGGSALIAAAVVFIFFLVARVLVVDSEYEKGVSYNAKTIEYNAMPLENRQLLWQYGGEVYADADPETYLLELKPVRSVHDTLAAIPYAVWWGVALTIMTITSLKMALTYQKQRRKKYFYVDFPHRTFIDILTFCAMYAALPAMLISWLRMLPLRLNLAKSERREVERLVQTWQITLPEVAHCSATDVKRYCNIRVSNAQLYHCQTIKQAEGKIQAIEQGLCNLGTELQSKQRQLNEARSKLQILQAAPSQPISPDQARAELQAIRKMRGVSQVVFTKAEMRKRIVLSFVVKVRVPYRDELYDFGDYKITFFTNTYICERIRSGVRADATRFAPDYFTGDGFCFGNRKCDIEDYVRAGRIVEAATLIVDSLHSVNNEDVARDIPYCFRKVSTVQCLMTLRYHQFSRR